MFFHALWLPGPEEHAWTRGRKAECSNISRGTRHMLMQWNEYVWSLFLHNFKQKPTENTARTLKYHFQTLFFSKQNGVSVKLSNVITSSQRQIPRATFSRTTCRRSDQSGQQRFPV